MQAGAVNIKLMADITDLQGKMQQAGKSVGGATSSMEKSVDTLKRTFAGLAGAFSIGVISKQVLEAQRSFDKLNAGLITATGSTENAAQAFKALQNFAATTPFSLEEAITAFIKMRNMGLDPSEKALRSYGNTSAAMGKSLEQMVEAVADAATGEFERLKEFGIKAKVEGDKVALTFQGNTTSIGNSSKEIEQYLQRIGEVEFGGGMALRAATLDGAISNLGDTWQQVMLTISQSGFGGAARQGVLDLSNALTDLGSILDTINASYEKATTAGEEMGFIHKSLTTIFETVAVLGVNLAHVFDRLRNTLGGFAAQVVALATFDFAAVSAIQTMMIEDNDKALKAVQARTAAILGAAEKTRAAAKAEAEDKLKTGRDDLARYKLDIAAKNEVSKADQALIKTAEEFLQGLKNEAAEASLTTDQIKLLTAARAAALAPTAALSRAINDQALLTIAAAKAAKAGNEAAKIKSDEMEKDFQAILKNKEAYDDARAAAAAYIATINKQAAREVAGIGRGNVFRERSTGISGIEDKQISQTQVLQGDLRRGDIDRTQFEAYLAIVNDTYAQEVAIYDKRTQDIKDLQSDWRNGFTEAFANYASESANVLDQTQELFTNAFRGMEDSLVSFVTTGKGSFSDLAQSIISDLIRIQIRSAMTNVIGGAGGLFSTIVGTLAGGAAGGGAAAGTSSSMYSLGGSGSSISGFRADGGPVSAGGLYRVNERGPEMLDVGGKQYLMMGNQSGSVIANGGGSVGGSVNVSVSVDAGSSSVQGNGDQSAQLGAMIGNAVRGVLLKEKRPGGMLA